MAQTTPPIVDSTQASVHCDASIRSLEVQRTLHNIASDRSSAVSLLLDYNFPVPR